jgi:UDP-N-acetyl-D-mannosaminuronic acid dehydrogenase/UDP-N-acetyl-D-glucosamine dehydrogenase
VRTCAIDPHVTAPDFVRLIECTPEVVADADVIVVLTDHDDVDWELVRAHSERVLDTCNRLADLGVDRLCARAESASSRGDPR